MFTGKNNFSFVALVDQLKYWPVFSNIPQVTQEKHQKHLKTMQDTQNSQSHYSLLVSAGGHYLRSLFVRKKRPYDEIDSAIKPLVDRMNTIQALRTIASCHGHWYGKPPYVYFKAPVHVAAQIERRLREDAMNDRPRLAASWCVHGLFDENYKQTFLLHAPEYHQGAESLIRAAWLFGARRRRLGTELLTLAQLVEPAMFTDIRQEEEP